MMGPYWTSKKSAMFFGCAELCDCGFFFYILWFTQDRSFVWAYLFARCSGIFVAYMYGDLKNKHRFFVLPSLIQSFALFLFTTLYFIWYTVHREDIARFYGENSVMHMFMYTAAISGMIVGVFVCNFVMKHSMFKRMKLNSRIYYLPKPR